MIGAKGMLLAGAASLGALCIWDSDTLADEVRGLPGAYELVVGRWFRHAPAYYEQRVATLPKQIESDAEDLAAYDDLAVAYERLRKRKRAIAVMAQKKEALGAKPDAEHLYRYHANLGTFYAHSGRFDEALTELRAAIEINPDAHFGRERFQIDLIRYVAAAREDPELWAKQSFLVFAKYQCEKKSWFSVTGAMSFSDSLRRWRKAPDKQKTTWNDAYTAVAGMLRFGGLEGAELYRALGDLFLIKRDLHLAWWSYKVAIERGHRARGQITKAVRGIEKHWAEASRLSKPVKNIPTDKLYAKVRANAKAWLRAFQEAETKALAAGKDTGDKKELEALLRAADKAVPALR